MFPQFILGFVQTRGIQEDHLSRIRAQDAQDPVPGGLRPVGDDGHLFPHQLVHQGALARIGASHNGHKAGAVLFLFLLFHADSFLL